MMSRTSSFAPVTLGDVSIVQMDFAALTDDDYVALNTFRNVLDAEAYPDDPPESLEFTRTDAQNDPPYEELRRFWAREPDGAIAGTGIIWWRRGEENRHLVWSMIRVRPDRRRAGLGKALLRALVDATAAEGRSLLMFTTTDRVPAGHAFAQRMGAEAGMAGHTNRLLIGDVDWDLVRRWIDEGPVRAPEYGLVWIDGPYPDDLIEDAAAVHGVMNTAPRGDLALEDETHTPEEIRQWEATAAELGTQRWSVFARHEGSGRLVGLSEVYWTPEEPETIWQGDTGVAPAHRGHALGKWMKAAMLGKIQRDRPGPKDIRTGNADSNDSMLGINNALGFKPYVSAMNWQVPVERVQAYLADTTD